MLPQPIDYRTSEIKFPRFTKSRGVESQAALWASALAADAAQVVEAGRANVTGAVPDEPRQCEKFPPSENQE